MLLLLRGRPFFLLPATPSVYSVLLGKNLGTEGVPPPLSTSSLQKTNAIRRASAVTFQLREEGAGEIGRVSGSTQMEGPLVEAAF